MWPRMLEVALALWLLASPLALGEPGRGGLLLVLACAVAVLALALLSMGTLELRRAHLLELVPAVALIGWGWTHAPAPFAQGELVAGVVLAMLAVLPTDALSPPEAWLALERARQAETPLPPVEL